MNNPYNSRKKITPISKNSTRFNETVGKNYYTSSDEEISCSIVTKKNISNNNKRESVEETEDDFEKYFVKDVTCDYTLLQTDNKDVIESDYNYITKFYDAKQPDIYFGSLPINSLAYKIAKQETINDLLKEDDDVKKIKENEEKLVTNNDGEEENVVKQKESRYFNVNLSIKCYNCGEIGHVSKFCPNEKVVICSKCNKKGHMFYACPEVKCFRCNKIGHKVTDCVEKILVVCNICNHNGHNQIQCLNRQDYSIKLLNKTDRKKIICDDCGVKGKHFLCKFDFINLDGKFDNCVSESSFTEEEEYNEEHDNNEEYCSGSNSHQDHNDSFDKDNRKENIQLLKKKIKKRLSDSEDTEKLIVSKLKKKINSRKRYDSSMSNLTETNINKIEDLEPGELDDNEVDKYRKNSNISIPNINAIDDDDAHISKKYTNQKFNNQSNSINKNEENKNIENYDIDENDSDYDNYVSLGLVEDTNRKNDLNKMKKEIISNNIKKIKKNTHSSGKSNSESSFNINDTTEFGNGNFFGEFLCPKCATKHTFKESCKELTNNTGTFDHIRNRYAGQNNKQYSNYNKDNRDYRDNRDTSYNNHRSNNSYYNTRDNSNYGNNYHSTNNYSYTRNNGSNYNQNSSYNNYTNYNNYSKFNDKYNNNSSNGNKYNVNNDINRYSNYYVNTSNNNINSFNNNTQKRTINRNWK